MNHRVKRRILPTLGPAPTKPIVPNMRVVHDRGVVEIQRGCSRGCRFCQAGIIYRPVRERAVGQVVGAIDSLMASTGYDEVGLMSLSSSDHSGIEQIVSQAMAQHESDGLAVSLPSLRVDSFSVRLAQMIQERRKTGFTFAPEAGSQRLRDVINKGVSEQDLFRTAEGAFGSGWNRIKLYFMIGLPTETDEDVLAIADVVRRLYALGKKLRGRRIDITVSASTFVPKPHTPFQWEPLASRDTIERRVRLLRQSLNMRGVRLSWSDWDTTWLEAAMSRGDERVSRVVHSAWMLGAAFDAWRERFQPEIWREAFEREGLAPESYTQERTLNEDLPWDIVDVGVTKEFLWRERTRALGGDLSPDCRDRCHRCGILIAFAGEHMRAETGAWGCPKTDAG